MQREAIVAKINDYSEIRTFNALSVPIPHLNHYVKYVIREKYSIEISNFRNVLKSPDPTHKLILLSKQILPETYATELHSELVFPTTIDLTLTSENFTTQEMFTWFAANIPYPNSFETVGHMAHYNLTPEQCPFKEVIGEITLFKCKNIKTVVNKTEKLHNIYRTPTLEHMAGIIDYKVNLKEVGISFTLDFEKVYWCSRLQQERDRLLATMKKNELLLDIFCGVGPLAIRAAKKGLRVLANDLNPHCYEYLLLNAKMNKVHPLCWNMCAREAMKRIYSLRNKEVEMNEEENQIGLEKVDHIYMNLPVDAIEFLDVLVDYGKQMKTEHMPLVHVNCFVVANDHEKSIELLENRIQKVLPDFKKEHIECSHHIKNVTVYMRMYCLSFRLQGYHEGLPQKRIKLE